MSIIEIVLIIAGVIIFILGYLLPAGKKEVDENVQLIGEDEVRKLVSKEVEGTKEHIADIVDETITYAMEKAERSMERVANEKIMAVNEYSDTVLGEINKNHQEVLFLYDMLNDKHENLKNTVSEVTKTTQEVKQTLKDAEITAREAEETVKNAMDTVLDAVENGTEEMTSLHTAVEFDEKLVEEVQKETANTTEVEDTEDSFVPIAPPHVAIIHNPEGEYDYVADSEAASEEIAQLLTKAQPKTEKKKAESKKTAAKTQTQKSKRKAETAKETKAETKTETRTENGEKTAPAVEIQFAGGKENGRNSNERILELHKAGKSNMAIAKELGLGIGEVKLVIDLFEG